MLYCHDIAEILFKVAINTINLNQTRKSLNVVLQDGLCLILNDKRRFVPSKWPRIDVFTCDLLCYGEQQQKMLAFHAYINQLTPPHMCACRKTGPGFPTSYIVVPLCCVQ
jgi:hypothetical protein